MLPAPAPSRRIVHLPLVIQDQQILNRHNPIRCSSTMASLSTSSSGVEVSGIYVSLHSPSTDSDNTELLQFLSNLGEVVFQAWCRCYPRTRPRFQRLVAINGVLHILVCEHRIPNRHICLECLHYEQFRDRNFFNRLRLKLRFYSHQLREVYRTASAAYGF
jgi:hypothetical protein